MTVKVKFAGEVHPYIEDLPIFDDKVDEIAESIDEVGLLHPVTLDKDGRVIGGRHRLEACEVAGIDPTFEVWEGDPLAFMLHDNDARKHQTAGQLAAEKALLLDSAGHRENKRWRYGVIQNPGFGVLEKNAKERLREAGIVLDFLGREALSEIAEGDVALNAAYEDARREKDRIENAERLKVEAAREEEERETYATDYFANHPAAQEWLDTKPEGVFETARAAFAAYQEHDREVRLKEEARKREEEEERRRLKAEDKRVAMRLQSFTESYSTAIDFHTHDRRNQVLECLEKPIREEFLSLEKHIKDWSLP